MTAETFRTLHKTPFIIPNPWDIGSARMLAGLGFKALATTSSGYAMTLGRRDYGISRDEALDHAQVISSAVDIPVSADLENGFGLAPSHVFETIKGACETNLAGGSIEDSTGETDAPVIEDDTLAAERIQAARDAVNKSGRDFVLTARAEAFLYGRGEINKVIDRLNAFADAGADVLYAPGLPDLAAIRTVCANVSKPVNVLVLGNLAQHKADEFYEAGVARLSIGGGLAWSAYGILAQSRTMLRNGSFDLLTKGRDDAAIISPFLEN